MSYFIETRDCSGLFGLVQAGLSHFRKLTIEEKGADSKFILNLVSTNGKPGKQEAGELDLPKVFKQRKA